jgi:hypothetical protein
MSHAPIAVIAENKATDLVAALTAGLRFPLVEVAAADVPGALTEIEPAAVVIAARDAALVEAVARNLATRKGPYVPLLACVALNETPAETVLPIAADAAPSRVVARLTAALRVSTLHAAVLRRAVARDIALAPFGAGDAAEGPTVLVAGRGGSYPALTMAVGERAGLIGALSFDTARRYLEARDIDGVVIGDGFSGRAVEDFLEDLRVDGRFRDLPIIVADTRVGALDFDCLPNAEHVRGGADRVLARLLPLVRLHAFALYLKRWAKSLETKGFVDPHTGLLTCDAFIHDLTRTVEEATKRKTRLSLARFSFGAIDERARRDAARIVGRLVRTSDFASQDDDGAILVAFGDTDLKAAHVVARRIASVLKHTMLAPDADARLNPEIALVTRKASDTAASLMTRLLPATIAAE